MFTHRIDEDAIAVLTRAQSACNLLGLLLDNYQESSADGVPADSVAALFDYVRGDITQALAGCEENR